MPGTTTAVIFAALVASSGVAPGAADALPEGALVGWVEPPGEGEGDELAAERRAERALVEPGFLLEEPDVALYLDPVTRLLPLPPVVQAIADTDFDIPVVYNARVQAWVDYFAGRGRRWFQAWLDRGGRYQPLMWAELEAAGLPRDLVWLAMIESGYNPRARSHASAVGLWQFIASTARHYGLRVDYWVDERRDPVASTRAAVRLLADLHASLGDWPLAWAAYNAGASRVRRAMARDGTRDFWEIRSLPPETRNYVPKLMAAAVIARNPERFGFRVDPAAPLRVERVEVEGAATLDVLARCAGVDEQVLRDLNPMLLRGATPPGGRTAINLPEGTAAAFARALAAIPPDRRVSWRHHVVRRGETLSGIARRYGVSTAALVRANHLRDPDRIAAGTRLVIPLAGALSPSAGGSSASARTEEARHRVSRGETLSSIAARYGVTVAALASRNGIRDPSRIRAGQVLVVPLPDASWRIHEVRPGENLTRIAARYGCTVEDLRAWNDLQGSVIHPGDELRVRRR